jgi:hypothetical protein
MSYSAFIKPSVFNALGGTTVNAESPSQNYASQPAPQPAVQPEPQERLTFWRRIKNAAKEVAEFIGSVRKTVVAVVTIATSIISAISGFRSPFRRKVLA